MPGRPCPVCGRGMYRRKQLLEHIKRCHGEYFNMWIRTGHGGGRLSAERRKKREAKGVKGRAH